MMELDYHLPQEILIDIFSRLPAKSVGRCRCLSKPWRALLCTPRFIKFQLNHKPNVQTLILISPSRSLHSISSDLQSFKTLDLGDNWGQIEGSCDGLVLLTNYDGDIFLTNPTTLQQVRIPDSPLALKRNESFRMHGFGYDSLNDDYKIVTLSYYNTDNEYEPDCADTFVDIYSAKSGVWKRVGTSPYDHAVPEIASGAFVNGAVHWLASSRDAGYPSVIAALDLAREVFDEMPAPNDVDVEKFVFNRLVVLGGCLCMVDPPRSGARSTTDLWIMKKYGSGESWMKCFSVDDDCDVIKPLCFVGGGNDDDDDDVVLATEDETLVVCGREDRKGRDVVVNGIPATLVDGGTFVETLVSPVFGANTVG